MKATTTQRRFLAFIITSIIIATTAMAQTIDLNVTIKGIQGTNGNIMIGVGDAKNPQMMKGEIVKITGETATTQIKEVPTGKVTLYIYHDENVNYQLDRDESGNPKEGCAISHTVVDEQKNAVEVTLYYKKGK